MSGRFFRVKHFRSHILRFFDKIIGSFSVFLLFISCCCCSDRNFQWSDSHPHNDVSIGYATLTAPLKLETILFFYFFSSLFTSHCFIHYNNIYFLHRSSSYLSNTPSYFAMPAKHKENLSFSTSEIFLSFV